MVLNAQDGRHGRICSLFADELRFPKLDIAGSIPVSRSMFSRSYGNQLVVRSPLIELSRCLPTRGVPVFIGVRELERQSRRLAFTARRSNGPT
jgi:hypothetical protein